MNYLLCDKNEIFPFFESIRQLKAKAVLDLGMVLHGCGAISRFVADAIVEPDVFLCGITGALDETPAVYHAVYNEVLTPEELVSGKSEKNRFDLSVCLFPGFLEDNNGLLPFIKDHASRLLCRKDAEKTIHSFFSNEQIRPVNNGGYHFLLITMKEGQGIR